MARRIAVCLSGGRDSTVLAHLAGESLVAGVFFDYGQAAVIEEREASQMTAERLECEWVEFSLSSGRHRRLYGVLDRMNTEPGAAGPRVVPHRNLNMLALACQFASASDLGEVWYGATRDDEEDYPDCRPRFVDALQVCVEPLRIGTPLLHLTGDQVQVLSESFGISDRETWSCYAPRAPGVPCRTCNACLRRSR